MQLTVHDVPNPGVRVTVTGNIFNTKKQSLGAGTVSLDNGESLGGIGAVPVTGHSHKTVPFLVGA